jgi:hemolysin D
MSLQRSFEIARCNSTVLSYSAACAQRAKLLRGRIIADEWDPALAAGSAVAAEIKIENFPFTRYGTIPDEVIRVSSGAVQNGSSDPTQRNPAQIMPSTGQTADNQGAVYAVRVKLAKDHIHADEREVALAAGMAVTAEIKIGRRRVIDYVLDPVLRYRDESLRER